MLRTKVKCPYCAHENGVAVDPATGTFKKEVVSCDTETGGCDRDFVAVSTVAAS